MQPRRDNANGQPEAEALTTCALRDHDPFRSVQSRIADAALATKPPGK
jgi:hypothetical protein